jgi:membrane-bound serine protease (ClpP class)
LPSLLSVALVLGCSARIRPLQDKEPGKAPEIEVLVVPLREALSTMDLALCHRALREAAGRGMRVVFRLDDAGGAEESRADVQALLDAVQASKVGTCALVRGHVQGGAAYLALVCDQLCMLPDAELLSVAPIETTTEAIRAMLDDGAARERSNALGAEMRGRLQRRKDHERLRADAIRLCEGMADVTLKLAAASVRDRGVESTRVVDATELAALQASGATIVGTKPFPQPVTLSGRDVEDYGLGQIVPSADDFWRDVMRVDRQRVGELQYSWSERMVGWLEWMQPALLVLGFVLLIFEVKTPGVGLPGVLGTAFLALAMFYSYLVGLAEVTVILLFFLGIASLGVEIFLLPGVVVFGAVGFLCLVASLILSRQTFVWPSTLTQEEILFHNLLYLTGLFVAVLVFASLAWRIVPRVPLLKRIYLPAPEPAAPGSSGVAATASPALVGRTAAAATVLRPAGVVEIDGERLDVVTNGEFVEAGRAVRIVAVEGNRIVVEPVPGGDGRHDAQRGNVGLVLLLVLVGLLLLVAEVFLVSAGVLFLMSAAALFGGVFLAFQEGTAFGTAVLVGESLVAPAVLWGAFRLLPRTRFGRALLLEGPRPEEVRAGDAGQSQLAGKVGVAVSPLRPAGFARIDGRRVDVVTRGEMLEEGRAVRVIEVSGNRVVVRADGGGE